uniref:Uncharacterized protein n=1 Tax=Anguilla anguilla TaxID=7936 RepID=A0A0E9W2J9_ANGAN
MYNSSGKPLDLKIPIISQAPSQIYLTIYIFGGGALHEWKRHSQCTAF